MALILGRGDIASVQDGLSAARLLVELEEQLSNPSLTPGQATETRSAIRELKSAWPAAERTAATATADDLGGLSPALRRRHRAIRQRTGTTSSAASNARARARRSQDRAQRTAEPEPEPSTGKKAKQAAARAGKKAIEAGARAAGSRRVRRAGEQTGLPGAARSVSASLLSLLGLMVLMSLAYLLLSNAERAGRGVSAVEQIAGGVSTAVAALIQPVDPLRPGSGRKAAAAEEQRRSPSVPSRSPGSVDPSSSPGVARRVGANVNPVIHR